MDIKESTTFRGFSLKEFTDLYGAQCSCQQSSLATEDAIWLGVDVDLNGNKPESARMHINREMAQSLIGMLQDFIDSPRNDIYKDEQP